MTAFFVPFADSPEQAERAYAGFQRQNSNNKYPLKSGRLFKIDFQSHGQSVSAEVGRDLVLRHEPTSVVLAIVESTRIVSIHTHLRGGLSATPILVSPDEVTERVYFDDFPAHA